MTFLRPLLCCLLLAVVACGTDSDSGQASASDQSYSGTWKGECAGEGVYLTLEQDGITLTGTHCEKPGRDCYPLINGHVSGGTLSFNYAFGSHSVTAELTPDGPDRLVGTYKSTKASGSLPAELARVPQP